MQNVTLNIAGQVYTFAEIVQVIGNQDPTAPQVYGWVAGLLGGDMGTCCTLENEISLGLLHDLPAATFISPCGYWQLDLLAVAHSKVGLLHYIGPELTASPWGLVWYGNAGTLQDLLPHTY